MVSKGSLDFIPSLNCTVQMSQKNPLWKAKVFINVSIL